MRIAFLNRGRETHPGGDVIALDETMAALRRLGIECEETGWDADRIAGGNFDLCHMFHCNFDWSWGNYQAIQKAGKKYVITPIYYPGLLSGIDQTQLADMLSGAERLLPFSEVESQLLPYKAARTVISNGTSRDFHEFRPSNLRTLYGRVTTVSSRGPSDKNCEKIIEACVLAGVHLNVVTDMTREEVATVLKDTAVFINASESERMSLTIGEALCAGCRVLATSANWGNEHYGSSLYTFDPKESVEVLAERIRVALLCTDPDWDWSPNIKARKITWDLVAAQLQQVYREVIGC